MTPRMSVIGASMLRRSSVQPPVGADPHWSDVRLLMPMSDDFSDAKGHVCAVEGQARIGTAHNGPFGNRYAIFGTGDTDRLLFPESADWALGRFFTIEFHVKLDGVAPGSGCVLSNGWDTSPAGLGAQHLVRQRPDIPGLEFFSSSSASGSWDTVEGLGSGATGMPTAKDWAHVAIVGVDVWGDGTKLRNAIFINGISVFSIEKSSPATYPATPSILTVGNGRNSKSPARMSICNLRLTANVARYRATFIPPTGPYPAF